LTAPYNRRLANRIQRQFTWPLAAQALNLAYESVLQGESR